MAGSTNEQQAESLFPREEEGGEKRGRREERGVREIERGQSESVLKMGGGDVGGRGWVMRRKKKQTRRINKKE